MRFPYSTEEGKRGCCSGKTFDAQNLLCCPDGSIRHGLILPTVGSFERVRSKVDGHKESLGQGIKVSGQKMNGRDYLAVHANSARKAALSTQT